MTRVARIVSLFAARLSLVVCAALPSACATDLPTLRARLDRVRATPPDETYFGNTWGSLSALIGKQRAELEKALGSPDRCRDFGNDSDAVSVVVAHAIRDCNEAREWTYLFYHLPQNQEGGGGWTMDLRFGTDGRCDDAVWINHLHEE